MAGNKQPAGMHYIQQNNIVFFFVYDDIFFHSSLFYCCLRLCCRQLASGVTSFVYFTLANAAVFVPRKQSHEMRNKHILTIPIDLVAFVIIFVCGNHFLFVCTEKKIMIIIIVSCRCR